MNRTTGYTVIAAALLLTPLVALHAAEPAWKLVLDENFDGTELNPQIWNVETGKRRDAVNSPLAVDVKDGKLVITTHTDKNGLTYCGFVTSRKKFFVTQGKTVARTAID